VTLTHSQRVEGLAKAEGWSTLGTQNVSAESGHMDTFFLRRPMVWEQILNMKTSPVMRTNGIILCPLFKIPGMKDLLRSWPSARALMRLMSRLDTEQTGVMLLG
jgi:hypothetical protein